MKKSEMKKKAKRRVSVPLDCLVRLWDSRADALDKCEALLAKPEDNPALAAINDDALVGEVVDGLETPEEGRSLSETIIENYRAALRKRIEEGK